MSQFFFTDRSFATKLSGIVARMKLDGFTSNDLWKMPATSAMRRRLCLECHVNYLVLEFAQLPGQWSVVSSDGNDGCCMLVLIRAGSTQNSSSSTAESETR